MTDKEFYDTLQEVFIALKAKGYSPYEQILGYLKTGSLPFVYTYLGSGAPEKLNIEKGIT